MRRVGRSALTSSQQLLPLQLSADPGTLFAELHRQLVEEPLPPHEISFYPYAGLKHTIRSRNGRVLIRLSDLLKEAEPAVFEATLALLICRLYRIRAPQQFQVVYRQFAAAVKTRLAARQARSKRGKKRLTGARGQYHDLTQVFSKLNTEYFGDQLEVGHLSWSSGKSRRVLGHYDRAHDAIVLSRLLDQPLVPTFVVEYVLYHEMLHAAHEEEYCGHRRRIHHERFRKAEQEFADYSRARRFIFEELC